MKNDRSIADFSESGTNLYPHFKITGELYPRVLVTRTVEDDGAEYFGAFLPKTAVRIMIDLINRVFRLRTCDIAIDGSFPVPCTMFYETRCLGPCVANLCSRGEYLDMVGLVRIFLSNDRGLLRRELGKRIALAAEELEFETAAAWRDMLHAIEEFWSNSRNDVWLDDCVDTYAADESTAGQYIYLATQRNRHILGRKAFHVATGGGMGNDEALSRIISSFYRFHLPREIRVSEDFKGRAALGRELSERFGREVKIVLALPRSQRITSVRALNSAQAEADLDAIKPKAPAKVIGKELMFTFDLEAPPRRIEAFDVAHISGRSFAAASSAWVEGRFVTADYRFAVSDEMSELDALAAKVRLRLLDPKMPVPDLLVLDGAKPQLNAVLKMLASDADVPHVPVITAAKPAGKHSAISHFLSKSGGKVMFDPNSAAHWMLQLLRDAAHDLSNRVHRDLRDMLHHYELAAMLPSLTEAERRRFVTAAGSIRKIAELEPEDAFKLAEPEYSDRVLADLKRDRRDEGEAVIPFIVPIRFDAENGDAEDLRPIRSR